MSIKETDVIDMIGTSQQGDVVILTATDHFPWGSREHLLMLQEKLNSYLYFLQSEEFYDAYPEIKGKQAEISVVCKYPPDEEGTRFLGLCREAIEGSGFLFSYEVHQPK